jgi:ribose 5-phosphate isomerase B
MKIAIGSDHRGYGHKDKIINMLHGMSYEVADLGGRPPEPTDYPAPAVAVGEAVADGEADLGILICGSGNGVCIAANKVRGVRASLCFTPDQAVMTRRHNDSNVLCLSGDGLDPAGAVEVVAAWLDAEFDGGRHARRVEMITDYETRTGNRE